MPQSTRFLNSIALELQNQADRVRDLIGDAHWISDGHHKEYLLKSVLTRYMPTGMRATRGFVANPTSPYKISREQDILIIDSLSEPPLYDQGGMVIAFPSTVVASISVKTQFTNKEIKDSVIGLNSVLQTCSTQTDSEHIWCGMFAFSSTISSLDESKNAATMIAKILKKNQYVPLLASPKTAATLGPRFFCSASGAFVRADYQELPAPPKLQHFYSQELAVAVFLQEIIVHLAAARGRSSPDFRNFLDLAWSAIGGPS